MRNVLLACVAICQFAQFAAAQGKTNENNSLSFEGSTAEVFKSVNGDELKIHIFQPQGDSESPRPAIVFFFGGGWKNGSPKQFEQHCRYLASRGMVAMTADYRVLNRQGTKAKECVQDGKSAIRWVRQNASRLNVNPDRIVAGGGSAGGHVAACTGVIEGWEEPGEATEISSAPNAMVLFNPAVTLAPFDGQEPLPEDRTERDGSLEIRMGTDPKNLSPAHHVRSDLSPTIMFFGTEDFLLDGGKFFHKQMIEAGNRCEMKLYEGHVHGFFNFGKNKNVPFAETLAATDEFLQSLGCLEGPENVKEWMSAQ